MITTNNKMIINFLKNVQLCQAGDIVYILVSPYLYIKLISYVISVENSHMFFKHTADEATLFGVTIKVAHELGGYNSIFVSNKENLCK